MQTHLKTKPIKSPFQSFVQTGSLQYLARSQNEKANVPSIVHNVLGSPGQPLDANTRGFMESRFGHNLSDVRVHTDARAAESARAVNALAYTVGRDMVFDSGQYAPATSAGQRLIAHELTHVAQQHGSSASDFQIGEPGNIFEREADRTAEIVTQGNQPAQSTPVHQSTLQRQDTGDTPSATERRPAAPPQVIVVPPPIAPRLQLRRPWLLGGERTPYGASLSGDRPVSSATLLGGQTPAFPSLTASPRFPLTTTLPLQPPMLFPPTAPTTLSTTATPSSGVPVNTSVGADVGYQAGEGHPVAEVSVTLTADWTAAQFRLGQTSGWSLNFLDQPSAGITVSFNPLAGSPEEVASLSHQIGINALSLVLTRDDDRLLEIAATSGFALDSGGKSSATVGTQITYHPTDHLGIFANGAAEIVREGNQLVPHWGSFTMGLTFDIDQDTPARRRH